MRDIHKLYRNKHINEMELGETIEIKEYYNGQVHLWQVCVLRVPTGLLYITTSRSNISNGNGSACAVAVDTKHVEVPDSFFTHVTDEDLELVVTP